MSGTVIIKEAKHMIPEAALEAALMGHSSAVGIAIALGDRIEIVSGDSQFATKEIITEALDSFKDHTAIMFLGKGPMTEESIQPFVAALNAEGQPVLAAFIEGDTEECAHEDSKHSSHFFAHAEEFEPLISRMHQDHNYDLDATVTQLREAKNVRKIAATFGENMGALFILAANGEIITISNYPVMQGQSLFTEFSWGKMLHSGDYKEAAPARPSLLKRAASAILPAANKPVVQDAATPIAKEEAAKDTSSKPTDNVQKMTPPSAKANLEPDEVLVKVGPCPSQVRKDNKKKKWWYTNAGFCPPNYADNNCIVEVVKKKTEIKDFKELPAQHVDASAATAAAADNTAFKTGAASAPTSGSQIVRKKVGATTVVKHPVAATEPLNSRKDLAPKYVIAKDTKTSAVSTEFMPVISPETKAALEKDFLTKVKKNLNLNSQVIDDPANAQAAENLHPDLAQQIGLNLEDTFKWDLEALVELGKIDSKALAILCQNYRNRYIKTLKIEDKAAPPVSSKPSLVNKTDSVPSTKPTLRRAMAM